MANEMWEVGDLCAVTWLLCLAAEPQVWSRLWVAQGGLSCSSSVPRVPWTLTWSQEGVLQALLPICGPLSSEFCKRVPAEMSLL